MGARLPVGSGLAAVRVAERNVDARHLLILQQDADHGFERDVRAEREFADPVAELVGVAIRPEFLLELRPVAFR